MQKEKILSELYHGNINPVSKTFEHGSEVETKMKLVCQCEEQLLSLLSDEQRKLFEKYVSTQIELNYISGEEHFIDGFRLGAKIIIEIWNENDGRLKGITD